MSLPKIVVWILMFIPTVLVSLLLIFVANQPQTGVSIVPFLLILEIFFIFWIVQDGSRWQKHEYLGPFARFIQKSQRRAFFVYLILTSLMVITVLMLMQGVWADILDSGAEIQNTTPVVNSLLLIFLLLSAMIPIMWGSFRKWRQAVRSAADVRVRTTA